MLRWGSPSPGRTPGWEDRWVLVAQGDIVELAEYPHDLLLAPLLAGGQPLRSLQVLQPAQALRLADHYPPSFRSWRVFFTWGACPSIDRGTYSSTALRASQRATPCRASHSARRVASPRGLSALQLFHRWRREGSMERLFIEANDSRSSSEPTPRKLAC